MENALFGSFWYLWKADARHSGSLQYAQLRLKPPVKRPNLNRQIRCFKSL